MQIRGIIRRKKERNRMTLEELPSPPRGKICCPPGEQTEWNSACDMNILFSKLPRYSTINSIVIDRRMTRVRS